jgi:hypothetical protein
MQTTRLNAMILALMIGLSLGLAACNSVETKAEYPTRRPGDRDIVYNNNRPGILGGNNGIGLFGKKKDSDSAASGIAVNAYLWRASLDTLSVRPIATADPFGGTILTDWYSSPDAPDERVKVNVFILDRTLRSDGVRVSIFRQVHNGVDWADATVNPQTATDMENTILTRARQLRVDAANK